MSENKTDKKSNHDANRDFWGYTCIIGGALFCILAIVFFILGNKMNFYAQKTEATIISRSDLETRDGKKKLMLEVSYKVGNEVVVTNFEYNDVTLPEDTVMMDIYYDVKNPKQIIVDGWSFHAVFGFVLGTMVLVMGLCIKGIIFKHWCIFETQPPKKASKYEKQVFTIRKKALENLFPFAAAFLSAVYGLTMIILDGGWGTYIFLILGAGAMIFFGRELIPALLEWNKLYRLSKMDIEIQVSDIEIKDK